MPIHRRELPWRPVADLPLAYNLRSPGRIVATGHPVGFGIVDRVSRCEGIGGYLPDWSYGAPALFLDLEQVPQSFWRSGKTMPATTLSGYHASRFAIGLSRTLEGDPELHPLLSIHTGCTSRSPKVWTCPGRYHGRLHPDRWVAFADLWATLPVELRAANQYRWVRKRGERGGTYERIGGLKGIHAVTPAGAECAARL